MNKTTSILSLTAALLTLSVATPAQGSFGNLSNFGNLLQTWTSLPSVQYRFNSFDRAIGNSWLGGSAHAYANITRQRSGTYELGMAAAEFRGRASVLNQSVEVAEIVGSATNIMNNGVQSRSGMFRVELLGYPVINSTFANSSTFAAASSTFNLLPGTGVSVSVPVGPISVTIRGNAGCGFGRSANWLLPAATATVGLNASANAYAFATASVSFGVPGFNVGVGLQGRILQQTLGGNVSASAVSGLSGSITYTLNAITLRLYAWATALYTWTTNLCTWSAGQVVFTLV